MLHAATHIGSCNCCGKVNVPVMVVSSSLGAISFAYCEDCYNRVIEPYDALVSVIRCALSFDRIDNYENELNSFYVDLINRCLEFYNKSREDFIGDLKDILLEDK